MSRRAAPRAVKFGILDLLTRRGHRIAISDARRSDVVGWAGSIHRPPGGESWVDVALRIRSLRDSLGREHMDSRVLLVTHEVVIVIWRYLLDNLDEARTLTLSREHPIGNCSLTRYRTGADDRLHLDLDAWTAPLEVDGVAVTVERDAAVAPLKSSRSMSSCFATGRYRSTRTVTSTRAAPCSWLRGRRAPPALRSWRAWRRSAWGPADCRSLRRRASPHPSGSLSQSPR